MKNNGSESLIYSTKFGKFYRGETQQVLESHLLRRYIGKVDLIFTSPPFPLNRKKKYGNQQGEAYIEWLADFAHSFVKYLKPTGSIVMEMGNSWEPGKPVMSTLALKALLRFQEEENLYLCQQFVWNNPAKLPTPAQWVNVERIRVKDAFTHIWWMSPTDRPKANNRNVLKEYSSSMQKLLESGKYNSGIRPSEHNIGETSFLKNNEGAIPSNVITESNNQSTNKYLKYCKDNNLEPHPARMPVKLAKFFINFLTNESDIVLDPFAGSNTTGAAAEELKRKWISIEIQRDYIEGSKGRFENIRIPNNQHEQ